MLPMEKINLKHCQLLYKVFEKGRVSLVIEIALGSTAGEWWHIAEHLSQKYTVLLYERSKNSKSERTPKNIANELYELLCAVPCEEQVVFVAHSQGGLYAQQFARLYPKMVKGIVFIDPL